MGRLRMGGSGKGLRGAQNKSVWGETNMGGLQGKMKGKKRLNFIDFKAFLNDTGRAGRKPVCGDSQGGANGWQKSTLRHMRHTEIFRFRTLSPFPGAGNCNRRRVGRAGLPPSSCSFRPSPW